MKKLSVGLLAMALALAGCGSSDKTAGAEADKGGDTAAAAAGGSGVAECDDYLNKVMACIDSKIPEPQRAVVKQGIEASKAGWAAVTDKAALASTCKMAMDQAKAAYSAMGCTF